MQCVYLIFRFSLIELQDLEVTNESKKNQKSKEEIKQEIEESFANEEINNADTEEKVRKVEKPEDVARRILFGWHTIRV